MLVTLNEHGGIVPVPAEDIEMHDIHKFRRIRVHESPDQVTCAGCGLSVERVRLDPDYKWEVDDESKPFKIKVHE